MEPKKILLEELATFAYQFRSDEQNWFTLASGERSPEYLDCKLALSHPRAMAALGSVILNSVLREVVAIGGLTMGADPIAMSTCQASAATDHQIRWFVVRKDRKAHGQKKLIEGDVERGARVAVVDDVVTSGKSTIQAIEACREFGLNIAQVIVLVDREQMDGFENIKRAAGPDVTVTAIYRKSEIKEEWLRLNKKQEISQNKAPESFARVSVRS
jgi:orotate phosphoribosyltransferase